MLTIVLSVVGGFAIVGAGLSMIIILSLEKEEKRDREKGVTST